MSPTSRSVIHKFLSNARARESIVGNQKLGTQTHLFNLLAVALYTNRMSSSPFGTMKYLMNDLIAKPVNKKVPVLKHLSNLLPRFFPQSRVSDGRLHTLGGRAGFCEPRRHTISHHPPKMQGEMQVDQPGTALNSNQFVWVKCQSRFAMADWSHPSSVNTPSHCWQGFPI
jgi:hypothetical protein